MNATKMNMTGCPHEVVLSDYLTMRMTAPERERTEEHLAGCDTCLLTLLSSFESVAEFKEGAKRGALSAMKRADLYAAFAAVSFLLSFMIRAYFLQFLVMAAIFSIKWIVDSKNTKMLIMIYDAWRKGGEKEASRILKALDTKHEKRL